MKATNQHPTKQRPGVFVVGFGCIVVALVLYCAVFFAIQSENPFRESLSPRDKLLCASPALRLEATPDWPGRMTTTKRNWAGMGTVARQPVDVRQSKLKPNACLWAAKQAEPPMQSLQNSSACLDRAKEDAPLKRAGQRQRAFPAGVSPEQKHRLPALMMRMNLRNVPVHGWIFIAGAFVCIVIGGFAALRLRIGAVQQRKGSRVSDIELRSAINHEFHAPLTAIRTNAKRIDGAVPKEVQRLAQTIEEEGGRLACLVNDLFCIPDQRDDTIWSTINPGFVLLVLYESYESSAQEKQIRLHVHIPAQPLPDIKCDWKRLHQALSVLVDNAMRYTPSGGHVYLEVERQKNHVAFTVFDSGARIQRGKQARLFEQFYRGDIFNVEEGHYALGFSVALEVVLIHGGELLVEDSKLGGAAFTARIPCSPFAV